MGGEGVKSRGERWRAWWVWGVAAAARGVRRRVAAAKAVFIVVRRNNWCDMGSKVGKQHGESTSHDIPPFTPL